MSKTIITKEHIRKLANGAVGGYFELSDGTKTTFSVNKMDGVRQWGNFRDNLDVTRERLDKIEGEMYGT